MIDGDSAGKTMRIDIHPDFLGQSLARKKSAVTTNLTDSTKIIARKVKGHVSFAQEFDQLLESIYDAVMITDVNGRILVFNSRALDFFILDYDEMLGKKMIELISGADESLLQAISKNLEEHRYTLIEAHCVRKDKSMFPAEIAVNMLDLFPEGNLCFFVRDITVRKRAQDALEEAVERLEAHDRSRSQFVSNVSHELRTPLTSMMYAVNNMLKGVVGDLPDGVKRYLEMMDADCRRLLGTVNDILDLRKIETKTLTLTRSRAPFARLVTRGIETLVLQATQKSVTLELHSDGRMWFADCDVNKMERVLLNIVGNAVKFTPEGGRVEVYIDEDPATPGNILLRVEDTGIGIPPEAIDKVCDRYFTVGEQAAGSGLGLAISKEIVEMHGGGMSIFSPAPGKTSGTGVNVSIPSVEPPSVLIVDDEPGVLHVLETQVRGQGYQVMTAVTGEEALERIAAEGPDLVVLDFILPGMEGTEVILKLKSDKATARLPIIVVTGAEVGRGRAQVLNSFSIPALSKPWKESELLDKIEGAFLGVAALNR